MTRVVSGQFQHFDNNYRDWAGLKWRPVYREREAQSSQSNYFRQISSTYVLWSYPRSLPNLLCSWEILPQKSPFSSATKYKKNTKKSPQFSILHKDVPFWYLDTRLLNWLRQQINSVISHSWHHFIQQAFTMLMTVRKYTIAIMMNIIITTQSKIP